MAAAEGNQYTRKYTLESALPLFEKALSYAIESNDCLCVQDAVAQSGIAHTTFYDLCKQFNVLNDIKKNINENVIMRINRGGLKGDFNPTASIWRMKQLGEKDKTEVANTVTNITPLTPEELKESKNKLDDLI